MIETLTSWLTPTVLFCVLNFMIGTILITSSLKKQQQPSSEDNNLPQLPRTPSLLQRVRSVKYFSFPDPFSSPLAHFADSPFSPQLGRSPSLLQRVRTINFSFSRSEKPSPFPSLDQCADPAQEDPRCHELSSFPSLDQCAEPAQEEPHREPSPFPSLDQCADPAEQDSHGHVTRSSSETCVESTMKKLKNEVLAPVQQKEEVVVVRRRPATVRERKGNRGKKGLGGDDEAVDRKADDFINKFKEQLKMQRIESIQRYTEMLNRGASI